MRFLIKYFAIGFELTIVHYNCKKVYLIGPRTNYSIVQLTDIFNKTFYSQILLTKVNYDCRKVYNKGCEYGPIELKNY
jgi:hypothetical protein